MTQSQQHPPQNSDSRDTGRSWQFYYVLTAIALGIIGIVAKVLGVI